MLFANGRRAETVSDRHRRHHHRQHPELKPANIGQALSWYTRSRAYLERLVEGAERVHLGGVAAGIVSPSRPPMTF